MCVLGFAAKHAGVTKLAMRGCGRITNLSLSDQLKVSNVFPWLQPSVAIDLIVLNDRVDLTAAERRIKIKKIFAENDWEVKFVR